MPQSSPTAEQVDRQGLIDWFRSTRARSRRIFDLVTPDAYYAQPIPLRHPIVFYDGHLAAFSLNTLVKRGLGKPGVDARLEALFARGIDPDQPQEGPPTWPDREAVKAFVEECDRRLLHALEHDPIEQAGHPLLDRAQAAYAIIEHEAMHQETLLYILHRLPYAQKRRPDAGGPVTDGRLRPREAVRVPAGRATLGARPSETAFGWDNEFPQHTVDVPAFFMDVDDVTNGEFLEFVEAGGYRDPRWWPGDSFARLQEAGMSHPPFWERDGDRWMWRGMFERWPCRCRGRSM